MPARKSAFERRRARFTVQEPHHQDAALEGLAEEIMGLTISDRGPDLASQPHKLWTSRQQFQEMQSPLERITSPSLTATFAETLQLAAANATTSHPFDPLYLPAVATSNNTPLPGPSALIESHSSSRTCPEPLTVYASTSNSPFLETCSPATLVPPQSPSPSTGLDGILSNTQLPRRLPRSTAAQKAIENDLRMATSVSLDLKRCWDIAALEPTLDLYRQLYRKLDVAEKSMKLLNHRDARVEQARNGLLVQHADLCKTLVTWRRKLDLPREVDTSKQLIIILMFQAFDHSR